MLEFYEEEIITQLLTVYFWMTIVITWPIEPNLLWMIIYVSNDAAIQPTWLLLQQIDSEYVLT